MFCLNRHILYVLLDGASDRSIDELGGRTPLQTAETPNLDAMAKDGWTGSTEARTYTHDFLLEFMTGTKERVPRGLVEAFGMGMRPEPGMVAHRLSPARIVDGEVEWLYRVDDAQARLLTQSVRIHLSHLGDDAVCQFYSGGRGVLLCRHHPVNVPAPPSPATLDVESLGPFLDIVEAIALDNKGVTMLPWGGAIMSEEHQLAPVTHLDGMRVISKSPSALGVGSILGLRTELIMDLEQRFVSSLEHIIKGPVLLHVEETDDVSHRRLPWEKVTMLETVDHLMGSIPKDLSVVVLIDHGASCVSGEHIGGTVPFMVHPAPVSGPDCFSETEAGPLPLNSLCDKINCILYSKR